jgi:ankyrin repeat protein
MARALRLSVACVLFAVAFAGVVGAGQNGPLFEAVRTGDVEGIRDLVAAGGDVNARAGDGSTALLRAAYTFDLEMAGVLIAAGANVDDANNYGVTPLLQASRTGDAPMIQLLLDAGADPNLVNAPGETPTGETPLMAASRSGNVRAVEHLLDRGADVNAPDTFENQTALMWASAEGHADVVGLLLEAGADPDRQAQVTSLATRRNADHPTGGFTALMWAARNGEDEVVGRLVGGGADMNLRNGDLASATMIAIYNDRFDTAAKLIELGADVNDGSLYTAVEMRTSTTDQFAFDGSRLRPNHDNEATALDLIELLLERGADPHQWFAGQFHSTSMPNSDRFANTPFFRAAVAADVEALRVLLDYVSDPDQALIVPPDEAGTEEPAGPAAPGGRGRGNPNEGRTVAMVAMGGGRAPAMTGGPGYIRSGDAPYREAGSRKPEDAFALLLDAGANPDSKAPDGATLLHQAVQGGNLEIIRSLARAGADFGQTNDDGLTALDVAEGRRPASAEAEAEDAPPGGRGRGGRGGRPNPEVIGLLRELMGLPPAPEVPAEEPAPALPSPGA